MIRKLWQWWISEDPMKILAALHLIFLIYWILSLNPSSSFNPFQGIMNRCLKDDEEK